MAKDYIIWAGYALKTELKQRGLPTTGLKEDMARRLQDDDELKGYLKDLKDNKAKKATVAKKESTESEAKNDSPRGSAVTTGVLAIFPASKPPPALQTSPKTKLLESSHVPPKPSVSVASTQRSNVSDLRIFAPRPSGVQSVASKSATPDHVTPKLPISNQNTTSPKREPTNPQSLRQSSPHSLPVTPTRKLAGMRRDALTPASTQKANTTGSVTNPIHETGLPQPQPAPIKTPDRGCVLPKLLPVTKDKDREPVLPKLSPTVKTENRKPEPPKHSPHSPNSGHTLARRKPAPSDANRPTSIRNEIKLPAGTQYPARISTLEAPMVSSLPSTSHQQADNARIKTEKLINSHCPAAIRTFEAPKADEALMPIFSQYMALTLPPMKNAQALRLTSAIPSPTPPKPDPPLIAPKGPAGMQYSSTHQRFSLTKPPADYISAREALISKSELDIQNINRKLHEDLERLEKEHGTKRSAEPPTSPTVNKKPRIEGGAKKAVMYRFIESIPIQPQIRRHSYAFVSANDIAVTDDSLEEIRYKAKRLGFNGPVRADSMGYFFIFKVSSRGDREGREFVRQCENLTFRGKDMRMKLIVGRD